MLAGVPTRTPYSTSRAFLAFHPNAQFYYVGMTKPKTLLLLDGNAIVHRAYHALPPLNTKDGRLVNAVYGFASTLLSVLEKFKPDYTAASFDLKAPTFRHEAYKEYKATRVKAPDDLYEQIPLVKDTVRAFGIPIYELEGFEADDVIGTLSKQAEKEGTHTIIVTGDMDTLQLVTDKTRVFTMRRGIKDTVLYDAEGVFKKYGFAPEQLPDFKGLRGDPSDNIPGVKGIGEKTASDLLKTYETLEGVYAHLADIKPAVREKLERDKMLAIKSKDLGTIRLDAPVHLDLKTCATRDFDRTRVVKLFQRFNFFSLIKRLPGGGMDTKQEVQETKYEMVTEENMNHLVSEIGKAGQCAFALDQGVGLAISYKVGRAWYVSRNLELRILNDELSRGVQLVGYDTKQAYKVFGKNVGTLQDILLEAYLLQEGNTLDLEKLVLQELGEEVEFEEKQQTLGLDVPSGAMDGRKEKVCMRADYILKLHASFADKLDEISKSQKAGRTLKDVLTNIELPIVPILADMETNGVQFNSTVFEGIAETINKQIATLEKKIHELADTEFNVNSTKQLREVLFKKLKISTANIKKTKTGYSTASSELQKIKDDYEIAARIEEYRELFKLKTTYIDVLPTLTDENGRIHTTFNQAVAATGRLSSTDPNLQNIPIRTDLGRLMRTAFVAPAGRRLVSADYSQIDLRCAAHVSGDKKLIEAFHRGEDIHTQAAAEAFQVAPSQVTKAQRRQAKVLNFGVLYGMGAFGFANAAGITREEGQDYIDAYMEKFSGLAAYLKKTKEFARKNGYVETLFGRRRYVPEINSPNFQVAAAGERIAINLPIQGLTADIMKLAMIAADKVVHEYGDKARMILQIHDELIFEVDEAIEQEFGEKIKRVMERVVELSVPLVVDVKSGDSWGEL